MTASLTCYLDESGHHAAPNLHLMAMGGVLGGADAWRDFDARWAALLRSEGVGTFHMKEFENYRGEFSTWTRDRHERFLAAIVSFLVALPVYFVGVTVRLTEVRPIRARLGKGFDPYYMLFQILIGQLAQRINTIPPQPIEMNVVAAEQPEYSANVARAFEAVRRDSKTPGRLGTLKIDSPKTTPALQAADLIAYETLKYQTNVLVENGARPTRWPMAQIAKTNRYLIGHGDFTEIREK